jgi:cell division protease FtsH
LEIQRFIKESYERARQILTDNREKLELIAQTLLDVETLDAAQINSLVEHGKLPDRPVAVNKDESTEDIKVNIQTKKEEDNSSEK